METQKLLIKFSIQGGDGDITYEGFFILTPELWEAFKELAKNAITELNEAEKKNYRDFSHIHVDCDDLLPVALRNGYDWFIEHFHPQAISEEEFEFFKKHFKGKYESADGIVSFGPHEIWSWVFDRDESEKRFGTYSGGLSVK
jgi:hypothetical protein